MATSQLLTDWKIIGRSGATVDGRDIPAIALTQAANNYNPTLFTALVWPEHSRTYNMGKVYSLSAKPNTEGGVDLLARIAPNDYYLGANNAGQKLFTSMELIPNFRGTKEWYLTGLAATDSPASAATSEMRFAAIREQAAYLGRFTAHEAYHATRQQSAQYGVAANMFDGLNEQQRLAVSLSIKGIGSFFHAVKMGYGNAEYPNAQLLVNDLRVKGVSYTIIYKLNAILEQAYEIKNQAPSAADLAEYL